MVLNEETTNAHTIHFAFQLALIETTPNTPLLRFSLVHAPTVVLQPVNRG